jgi:ubiquinone/menaquinone biosynthesis C-methylase UbiE
LPVDAVICTLALAHLAAIDKPIQELARVVRRGGRVFISDVHPFPILLGWRAQFRTASGESACIGLHAYLVADYYQAFAAAGLRVQGCYEPRLTPEAAGTVAGTHVPEAQRATFGGMPGVII